MDELIDILNEDGAVSGQVELKSIAHKKGLPHHTIHIWIITPNGEVLLQQRAFDKDTFPGMWDIAVAGHIGAGEDILESAVREFGEELGVKVQPNELVKIGTHRSIIKHSPTLIDNELHHIYMYTLQIPPEELILQEEEVADVKLIPLTDYLEFQKQQDTNPEYVPLAASYQKLVFPVLKNNIK